MITLASVDNILPVCEEFFIFRGGDEPRCSAVVVTEVASEGETSFSGLVSNRRGEASDPDEGRNTPFSGSMA